MKLWRSGIILSLVGLLGGLGNYVFLCMIGRQLPKPEVGYTNSTLVGFIGLLGLPLLIASTSVVHYIAHFRANNDEARLQGLLSGCQKFLLKLTVAGSLLSVVLIKPLSDFFNFPRASLMLAALACVLVGLWSGFAIALCQGMAWFKRMAFIGLAAVGMRLIFGWLMTRQFPVAEAAVSATTFSLLANLALLYWRKDLFKKVEAISPWNLEFLKYLIVAAACMGGGYCFTQGDLLVAQRYFTGEQIGDYTVAGRLANALIAVVGPLLLILFTSRSGHKTGQAAGEQKVLLALYAVGLAGGALVLLWFRDIFVKMIFGKFTPEAADMVVRYTIAMFFIGLIQALGMWALASRWFKTAILYGALGLTYWLILLGFGKTPATLLHLMPIEAAVAFVILLVAWLFTLRGDQPGKLK